MASGEAEFLISQSTHTCLSVIKGTGPHDAIIGLAPCTGKVNQQWYVSGTAWRWAGNTSYCLAPNMRSGSLCLVPYSSSPSSWNLDEDGVMSSDGQALDVPWQKPRTKVIMYPKHGSINQKWWTFSTLKRIMGREATVFSKKIPQHIQNMLMRENGGLETHRIQGKGFATTEVPNYLISQSTHTCLTVISGSNSKDAVVGLAALNGSERQKWFVSGGKLQWGGNRSYCLVPNWKNFSLSLGDSHASTDIWTFHDDSELVGVGQYVLDVPWQPPRHSVILYPKHGGENQKWWTVSNTNCSGGDSDPISAVDEKYKQEICRSLINKLSPLSAPLPYKNDAVCYPGNVPVNSPRIARNVTLDLRILGQDRDFLMTVPEDWQATDMYIAAGDVFDIILPDTMPPQRAAQITVRVGAQCDCLDPTSPNVKSAKKYKRKPIVTEVFELTPGRNSMRSQFGGNLIFMLEEGERFTVDVKIHGAVEAPYYKQGQTTVESWNRMKALDVPYSILESEQVVMVVPTSAVRKVCNIDCLLQRYNTVMTLLNDLAGFDAKTDPPPRGKQWMVDDIQISAGSAHAGFPAMFDCQYYDLTCDDTAYDWVTWHELGHNFQQKSHWSYTYGSETTVNLFSLYIQETLMKEDRLKKENRYHKTAVAVDKGLTFAKADCWEKLVFLMEIKHAFPVLGWDMFRQLNKVTRALPRTEANKLSSNTQLQFDHVYDRLSRAVRSNLIPHYQRWGIKISDEAQRNIKQLGLPMAPADLSSRGY